MGNGDARCALFSQIQEGVKLKTRKERDELLNQINQTKSDEKKPQTDKVVAYLQSSKAFQNHNEATHSSDSEDEYSDHGDDWIYDGPENNHSHKVRVFSDTSRRLNPQARSQSSTNNKSPKPPVSDKPPGLMKMPNKAADPVNASIDQTQVSFVKSRSNFFENRG